MFCPKCKLEYRQGFTTCSDCGVPLVRDLTDASVRSNEPQDPEGVDLLWTGTDPSASSAIANALDAAKIYFHTSTREVGPLPGLAMPVYAILIRARDQAIAHTALADALRKLDSPAQDAAEPSADAALPGHSASPEEDDDRSAFPLSDYLPEEIHPDDATAEVWSGSDAVLAQGLNDSLRENGIGCVLDKSEAGMRIAVRTYDEARAREIIREVVEATPPE